MTIWYRNVEIQIVEPIPENFDIDTDPGIRYIKAIIDWSLDQIQFYEG